MGFFKEEDLSKYEKLSGVELIQANDVTRTMCNAELQFKLNEAVEKLTNMGIEIVSVQQTPPEGNGFSYLANASITWRRSPEQLEEIKKLKDEYNHACSLLSTEKYDLALSCFQKLPSDYEDVANKINECISLKNQKIAKEKLEIAKENLKIAKENDYNKAKRLMDIGDYKSAYKILRVISDYKDGLSLIHICCEKDADVNKAVEAFKETKERLEKVRKEEEKEKRTALKKIEVKQRIRKIFAFILFVVGLTIAFVLCYNNIISVGSSFAIMCVLTFIFLIISIANSKIVKGE